MARVRAPALVGSGGWINVDELALADLRGRPVLLHFWASCCVNCLRTIEALRGLERSGLAVVSVHAPKFPHERDHDVVRAAVARHRIEHPVLDDAELVTWDAFAVSAWPTLVLVDPAGYVVGQWSGEGHEAEVAAAVAAVASDGPLPAPPAARMEADGDAELAFPGGVACDPRSGRIAIADTGHDRVLVCDPDGSVLAEHDGLYQPQGLAWSADGSLLACEEPTGVVWRLDGSRRSVVVAGLASPWDVVEWHGHPVVAEAGRHRLRAVDAAGEAQVIAGSGVEGLRDGEALTAMLAQPSGLCVDRWDQLCFVDAESSSLRTLDVPGGTVRTLVGEDLWTWGAADGEAAAARLQHPLGVAHRKGRLFVADTFNDALRVWQGAHLWTVPLTGLTDPGGLDVLPDGRLVVADTGGHRVLRVDPWEGAATELALGPSTGGDADAPVLAETLVLPAGSALEVELDVALGGDQLDLAGGEPVQLLASASVEGLLAGEDRWALDALPARVLIPLGTASGRVTVQLRAATCAPGACRLRRTHRAYDVILTGEGS